MTTHSSIPAWRIPWSEESGGLQSMGSQRDRHDLLTKQHIMMDIDFHHFFLCISNTQTNTFQY